jgi:hypothetical protein
MTVSEESSPSIWPASSEEWAESVWVMRKTELVFRYPSRCPNFDPGECVRRVTRNIVLCGGSSEYFSTKMPCWTPSAAEEQLFPIDVLYGCYDAVNRSIQIFVDRIRQDAPMFNATPCDLERIVRIHEYAHAIAHLGVPLDYADDHLSTIGSSKLTDWEEFIARRTDWFRRTNSEIHELLAQAITWSILESDPQAERLCEIFELLEEKQPSQYRLPGQLKAATAGADWPLILDVARGVIDRERPNAFEMIAALRRLITMQPRVSEWAIELGQDQGVRDLHDFMEQERDGQGKGNDFELLLDRFGSLKVEVFAREHPPPHFRVICAGESANFRISDCHQLNGGLRKYYRKIREWHAANKPRLIHAWNDRRPSDCPVGIYKE